MSGCPVCYEAITSAFRYRCRHTVCTTCAKQWYAHAGKVICPLCRTAGTPPAVCITSPITPPGYGMRPYTSKSPSHNVVVAISGVGHIGVNVSALRDAAPLRQYWLQVGFSRYPLFQLPEHPQIVDGYTRAQLLSCVAGEVVPLQRRLSGSGVYRTVRLDPDRPDPATLATLIAMACGRLAEEPQPPPPLTLVTDLIWDGCTLAVPLNLGHAAVVDAAVHVLSTKCGPGPPLAAELRELLHSHCVRW